MTSRMQQVRNILRPSFSPKYHQQFLSAFAQPIHQLKSEQMLKTLPTPTMLNLLTQSKRNRVESIG